MLSIASELILSPIPFNRPVLVGKEIDYILDAVRRMHISGEGYYTMRCHQLLQEILRVPKILLTTSCTHALEMTALLLDFAPGDEVIMPSFTFVSTANAYVLRGAKPVFVDIRPDTLNIDERLIESRITARTKAIVVVHYAGVACEMDAILQVGARHRIPIIEDNAHGLFGSYKNRYLGTFGALATQSFHETKNFTCGEGGALLINAPEYIDRAEMIREKGTNRTRFFRGLVDKYTWTDVGSSYVPSEILAGFLFAQLEARDHIKAARERAWQRYATELPEWANAQGIRLPLAPEYCKHTHHMFYLILPSLADRENLRALLTRQNILSVFHYVPLHLSSMGRRFAGKMGDCPVTEQISERLLRLPLYNDMTDEEQSRVIDAVHSFDVGPGTVHEAAG